LADNANIRITMGVPKFGNHLAIPRLILDIRGQRTLVLIMAVLSSSCINMFINVCSSRVLGQENRRGSATFNFSAQILAVLLFQIALRLS
jgi:hypothetical protein